MATLRELPSTSTAIGLPRGIPAASLKRGTSHTTSARGAARACLPRGIPAASLKRFSRYASLPKRPDLSSSAGNTRGLIEACVDERRREPASLNPSSAGNTRGLIEARTCGRVPVFARVRLPRGIPAASLKHCDGNDVGPASAQWRLPRGIPAASLKRRRQSAEHTYHHLATRSSAGNTRGLIEADDATLSMRSRAMKVFRGEYPRPH